MRPWSRTRMRSALQMVDRRWATTKAVRPLSSRRSASWISSSVWVSMDEVASSRIRIRGSARKARAKEISWRWPRSEEHTSELQSRENLVCRLLLEKKNKTVQVEGLYFRHHRDKAGPTVSISRIIIDNNVVLK